MNAPQGELLRLHAWIVRACTLFAAAASVVSCGSDGAAGSASGADAGGDGGDASAAAGGSSGATGSTGGRSGANTGGRTGDAGTGGSPRGGAGGATGGSGPGDASVDAPGDAADSSPGGWDCSGGVGLRCSGATRLIGTAVASAPLAEPTYAGVLAREFDYVTPENATKWESLEPTRGTWSFGEADGIIQAAEDNHQAVKGHAFVWHQQAPAWVAALSPAELRTELERHITTTATRYRGRVRAWDVVNEAIDDASLSLRAGIHATLGVAGLADAFKWARAADPGALLYYNDYSIEGVSPKSEAVFDLLRDLLAAGAPIDGVGLQAHISTRAFPSEQSLRQNMQRFASLGLRVNLSELDVRTVEVPGARDARLAAQRIVYQLFGGVCATEAACESLTTWGFTDAHSWVDALFGADDPLPFDETYAAKPAYDGLASGLSGKLPTSGPTLITNGSCSGGTTGWAPFGAGMLGTVANGRSGTACGLTGRTGSFNGLSQSLLGLLSSDQTVSASAWVKASAADVPVYLTLKTTTGGSDAYARLAETTANATGWTLLTGAATLAFGGAPTAMEIYVEGPPAGVDLMVDDFELVPLSYAP